MAKLIRGQELGVEVVRKADKYGRVVGIVTAGGEDVAMELIESGLAWVDERFCRRENPCDGYRAAQKKSKLSKKGLWRKAEPEAPWVWRLNN